MDGPPDGGDVLQRGSGRVLPPKIHMGTISPHASRWIETCDALNIDARFESGPSLVAYTCAHPALVVHGGPPRLFRFVAFPVSSAPMRRSAVEYVYAVLSGAWPRKARNKPA